MPTKTPRLYQRNGIFYLRIVFPKEQQIKTGKVETWRSLRTKNPAEAKIAALTYALERERAKAGMGSEKALGDLVKFTNEFKVTTSDGFSVEYDPDKPKEKAEAMALLARHEERTANQPRLWTNEDRQRLRESESEYQRLLSEHEAIRAAAQKQKSPLFKDFAEAYLILNTTTHIKERTKKVYAAKLKVWQDFIGETAKLDDITPQTILKFQTWLGKDDPETKRKAVSSRTIDSYTEVISHVYNNTIKKLADNPVGKRLVSKKERMKSTRKPFAPDELTQIFDPVRLNACKDPADFFVPILGLLTGSRPSAICQLRLCDIRQEDGIWVISFHDYFEDNSSKNTASNRIVPLHPILEQIGFLRYLEDIRNYTGQQHGRTLIFPWLNKYEQGYADVPTQKFRDVLKDLGIYVYNVKVFYSLRHTTNQRMKDRGVPEDFRCQYIGHENDSVNNLVYGGITPTKFLLKNVIPSLGFEEIAWDKITYTSNIRNISRLYVNARKREILKEQKRNEKP